MKRTDEAIRPAWRAGRKTGGAVDGARVVEHNSKYDTDIYRGLIN